MGDRVTIMDGGMGRLLLSMGAPFKQPEWSALALMEAPEYVGQAHKAFIEAGAEIIITNSYALVPFHIGQERFDTHGRDLIKLAGEIADNSVKESGKNVKIAGSIPPAFGSYRPDLFIEDKAEAIYLPLIEEQDPYIDFWLAETVSSIKEAKKIGSLLKNNDKPYWISYTLKDREDKDIHPQLRSKETIEDAVNAALELNAATILFNCSQPEEMEPALEIIQKMEIDVPYGVYANAFEAITRDEKANNHVTTIREDNSPENYLNYAQKWKNMGASVIGGCCGINPEHIRELSKLND